jgi:hypothetical protein
MWKRRKKVWSRLDENLGSFSLSRSLSRSLSLSLSLSDPTLAHCNHPLPGCYRTDCFTGLAADGAAADDGAGVGEPERKRGRRICEAVLEVQTRRRSGHLSGGEAWVARCGSKKGKKKRARDAETSEVGESASSRGVCVSDLRNEASCPLSSSTLGRGAGH